LFLPQVTPDATITLSTLGEAMEFGPRSTRQVHSAVGEPEAIALNQVFAPEEARSPFGAIGMTRFVVPFRTLAAAPFAEAPPKSVKLTDFLLKVAIGASLAELTSMAAAHTLQVEHAIAMSLLVQTGLHGIGALIRKFQGVAIRS
jgi:hypothetical protein